MYPKSILKILARYLLAFRLIADFLDATARIWEVQLAHSLPLYPEYLVGSFTARLSL